MTKTARRTLCGACVVLAVAAVVLVLGLLFGWFTSEPKRIDTFTERFLNDYQTAITVPRLDELTVTVSRAEIDGEISALRAEHATKHIVCRGDDVRLDVRFFDANGVEIRPDGAGENPSPLTVSLRSVGDNEDAVYSQFDRLLLENLPGIGDTEAGWRITMTAGSQLAMLFPDYVGKELSVDVHLSQKIGAQSIVCADYVAYVTDLSGERILKDGAETVYEEGEDVLLMLGTGDVLPDVEEALIDAYAGARDGATDRLQTVSAYVATEGGQHLEYVITPRYTCDPAAYDDAFVLEYFYEDYGFTTVSELEENYAHALASEKALNLLTEQAVIHALPDADRSVYEEWWSFSSAETLKNEGIDGDEYVRRYLGYDSVDAYLTACMERDLLYYAIFYRENLSVAPEEMSARYADYVGTVRAEFRNAGMDAKKAAKEASEFVSTHYTATELYDELVYEKVADYIWKYVVYEEVDA